MRRAMFALDAERAHELGALALRSGVAGALAGAFEPDEVLRTDAFGLSFKTPLGIAAGFDKNGVLIDALAALGFGFVEAGTVTFRPQDGNAKPRLFRLPDDEALINRLGFNNAGAEAVAANIKRSARNCVIGVNIGKNRDVPNEEAAENYLAAFEMVHPAADYIAVNISSPNTPKLRELQQAESLDELLAALQRRNAELGRKPLLVKIAPDLTGDQIRAAAAACLKHEIDAIIATNTTISREGLRTRDPAQLGEGGLSGRPLRERSNAVIAEIFRYTDGKLPIVGVGGIFNAADALEKITSGASLIQAYTGFVYNGPSFARHVAGGLAELLKEHGYARLTDAVGAAVKR